MLLKHTIIYKYISLYTGEEIEISDFLKLVAQADNLPVSDHSDVTRFGIQVFGLSLSEIDKCIDNVQKATASAHVALTIVQKWVQTRPAETAEDLIKAMNDTHINKTTVAIFEKFLKNQEFINEGMDILIIINIYLFTSYYTY